MAPGAWIRLQPLSSSQEGYGANASRLTTANKAHSRTRPPQEQQQDRTFRLREMILIARGPKVACHARFAIWAKQLTFSNASDIVSVN